MDEVGDAITKTQAAAPGSAVQVERPSTKSEWTLAVALVALCLFTFVLIGVLAWWGPWGPKSEGQRINFLGWMGWLSTGGVLLIIVAIASPFVGHISAKAGPDGADVSIDGKD